MMTRQAVILVGGKGTRLGALASSTPKPLMAIGGDMVFLDALLLEIVRHGFDDILLLAGHLHEKIRERYCGRSIRGASLRVVVESGPAGTAGALRNAASLLDSTFLLANGDTLFDINLRRLSACLETRPDVLGVLALRRESDSTRYGSVRLQDGYVVAFREKESGREPAFINAGVGVFRREMSTFVEETPCSMELDVYPRLAAARTILGEVFDGYFIDIGTPESLRKARLDLANRRRPAVFFDRDGVLNHDAGYCHRVDALEWTRGAVETIRLVNEAGALAIVVSNQAGVAHGLFCEADIDRFHAEMSTQLAAAGAHIDAFYFCPYHPDAAVAEWRHPDHPDRKPNPGMIRRALAEWPIDMNSSLLIGDKASDMEAARRAGIRGILFQGGDLYASTRSELEHVVALRSRTRMC
ncbi:HAD-IIIA family hydrolase [Methylosinus sporium]|uniref:HAD-IIIA family hydrolase n=1 Tax=Methylosinus sporium TaxID=428 RepID=UPI00132FED49|nr:HAD-IIIA family hydrolase [Methylosinus sporium]